MRQEDLETDQVKVTGTVYTVIDGVKHEYDYTALVNRTIKTSTDRHPYQSGYADEPVSEITAEPNDVDITRLVSTTGPKDHPKAVKAATEDAAEQAIDECKNGATKQSETTRREGQDHPVSRGTKLEYLNRTWTVTKIMYGLVFLKSEGLPEQSIDWLRLQKKLDVGHAKIV